MNDEMSLANDFLYGYFYDLGEKAEAEKYLD